MVAMVVCFGAEDVREIRRGWGRDFSKGQRQPNKRMKLAPPRRPTAAETEEVIGRRRGRRVTRVVQGTPRATAWRSLPASR
jgi:hypothetical protein